MCISLYFDNKNYKPYCTQDYCIRFCVNEKRDTFSYIPIYALLLLKTVACARLLY
jgi:hypothetical protein